ncbi:hypothetical protein GFGA_1d0406 [Gluconobacter frateurii NBRC 103465]|nr:hypothetical protein GFGA_1d0406 [Gluconobacter frateurii NBRC 103465]
MLAPCHPNDTSQFRIKKIVTHKSCRKTFFSALALSAVMFFSSHAQAKHLRGSHGGHSVFRSHRASHFYHHHTFSTAHFFQWVALHKKLLTLSFTAMLVIGGTMLLAAMPAGTLRRQDQS